MRRDIKESLALFGRFDVSGNMGMEYEVQPKLRRHFGGFFYNVSDIFPLSSGEAGAAVRRHSTRKSVAHIRLRVRQNQKWRFERSQQVANFTNMRYRNPSGGRITQNNRYK